VMGDLGTPVLLLAKGADEHDFALRPSQALAVAEAGLVVWIGPKLTPWLDRALGGSTGVSLALLAAQGTQTRDFPAEAAEEHEEHEEGEEPHEGTDPHAWLDPGNAAVWLGLIAAELARIDPENAPTYAANAAQALAEVQALDASIAATLAPVADRPFVVFHAAYGYFIAHYGLQTAGALREGDAASPGAARIAALRDTLAQGGVRCVFPEVQHDPVQLAQLVEGTNAKLGAALDPVGSTLDPGPGAYAALLTGLAGTLAECLKD
jgi:zinc transport system substrate-binding protein